MLRKLLLHLCVLLLPLFLKGQTPISGVINDYAAVTGLDSCRNALSVSSTIGFRPGLKAILIQMQGASIRMDNSNAFGDVVDLNAAGYYEQVVIQSVENPGRVIIQNQLLYNYQFDQGVQLVTMPDFDQAVVTGTLTAKPWDGLTGGVIALEVRDTLRLTANVDASGAGFRGGQANIQPESNCAFVGGINNYAYSLGDWRGAGKGEGITKWTTGAEAGRGAQANGGGGGNDHNSGGGGGANASRGGRGGRNAEPSFFGCSGNFPGEGGKIASLDTLRLFLGGGGGAGDENNDESTDGGRGGGIIFLSAGTVIGNNYGLLANGAEALGTTGDGAGGGGAGGSIFLLANEIVGVLDLEVNGGKGGDMDNNNANRCHGPGGGGSGGRLLFPASLSVNSSLTGGAAGQSLNSASGSCGDSENLAQPGEPGISQSILSIAQSDEILSQPEILSVPGALVACEGNRLEIPVRVAGQNLLYQWQRFDDNDFVNLPATDPYQQVDARILIIDPISSDGSMEQYRLQVTSNCGDELFSDPISVQVLPRAEANFAFSIDGQSVSFRNQSTNATSYSWFFGDGNNSQEENPTHIYGGDSTYEVTLIADSDCGPDTFRQMLEVDVFQVPMANFSFSPSNGCSPLKVQFSSLASGDFTEISWEFPGGDPSTSTDPNPIVNYTNSGSYTFVMYVRGPQGEDSLLIQEQLNIEQGPEVDFSYSAEDQTAQFQNNSIRADRYRWIFGDGAEATEENPQHTYSAPGAYEVQLIGTNACGSDTLVQSVNIGSPPLALFSIKPSGGCAPVQVAFSNLSDGTYTELRWEFPGGEPNSSLEPNPVVIYRDTGIYDVLLIVDGPLGSDQMELQGIIEVLPVPEPVFSYELRGDSLFLINSSVNADGYRWNFDDGSEGSREANPVHIFRQSGIFDITLNASNAYCAKSASQTVQVVITDTDDLFLREGISVYPNPTSDILYIDLPLQQNSNLKMSLVNSLGQRLQQCTLDGPRQISLSGLPAGIYLLIFENNTERWGMRVNKW